eukprot:985003-Rhodomonas_salina.1
MHYCTSGFDVLMPVMDQKIVEQGRVYSTTIPPNLYEKNTSTKIRLYPGSGLQREKVGWEQQGRARLE